MRIFLSVLILIFSLQTFSKANEISDFEIEGISIGDSLLDYFNENEIKKALQETQYPGSDKFIIYSFRYNTKFENYDAISVDVKKNDRDYKIYAISGIVDYDNNIDECYLLMEKISSEFKEIFKNSKEYKIKKSKLRYDKTGKSYQRYHAFDMPSGESASLECNDWSDEVPNLSDALMVSLMSSEYVSFLQLEAYN